MGLISTRGPTAASKRALLKRRGFDQPATALRAIDQLVADRDSRQPLRRVFNRLLGACQKSADPDRALIGFERLVTARPRPAKLYRDLDANPDWLPVLATVFAHSQALSETLTQDADYFDYLITPGLLSAPKEKAWLAAELRRLLLSVHADAERYDCIRQFRRRETLRIGTRDLMGLATVEETTAELSHLADVCLQNVYEIARDTLAKRYRVSLDALTGLHAFTVIGMGKLGGHELNYSSDIDVIFVYGEDGPLRSVFMNFTPNWRSR